MWKLLVVVIHVAQTSWCDDSPDFALEWADEFSGEGLNRSAWSVVCNDASANGCDALPFRTHAPSNGAECRSALCVADAVTVQGGFLTLTSSRVPGLPNNWTTGAVKSRGKVQWSTDDGTYRMCVSAILPGCGGGGAGQGMWPAHWAMPAADGCDPDQGEMDIMEMVNGDGQAEATYHWQANYPNATCAYPVGHEDLTGAVALDATWATEFHEFAVERSASYVAFAIDGVLLFNSSASTLDVLLWPVPFYLILNSAVGGAWPGEPNASTVSPQQHVIDYVRVARQTQRE